MAWTEGYRRGSSTCTSSDPRHEEVHLRVVIAGGHGQIALLLERALAEAGHEPRGIIRNPDHVPDLQQAGATAVVLDLEQASVEEVAAALEGADAVVFAAGGGPDSGVARKETVDKGAAILLADAAELAGVRRYVMVSSLGTDRVDEDSDDVFQIYLRAKRDADDNVRARDLDWTIVQPGRLTNDAPTGLITAGAVSRGDITRADVAAALAVVLENDGTIGHTLGVVNGETPISEAIAGLG